MAAAAANKVRRRRALLALLALAAGMATPARAECRLESGPQRSVASVIDGETFVLDDGSEVRLIGALAPRASDIGAAAGTWPAETAAREALAVLVLSKSVILGFGGERRDRHGRWLAQVFVGEPGHEVWVQGRMLAEGAARSYAIGGNRACAAELLAHEAQARERAVGLWSEAAYAVRADRALRELVPLAGTFQIVEGRITRVIDGRGEVRILFGDGARRGLSVTIRRGDRDLIGELGGNPRALEGRRVEVRGWLEQRGPASDALVIDVSTAGQLRLLDGAEAATVDASATPRTPRRRSRPDAAPPPAPIE